MAPKTKSRDKTRISKTTSLKADTGKFETIVLGPAQAGLDSINIIRRGYPARILRSASAFLEVTNAQIQRVAKIAPTTASRLEKADANIEQAVSERVYRMGTVTRMAVDVFQDKDMATNWMRQPNLALGGATPLELMDTEPGADSVRLVLNAIATGGVA